MLAENPDAVDIHELRGIIEKNDLSDGWCFKKMADFVNLLMS